MKKFVFLFVLVVCVACVQAKVVHVEDYGIVPGGDVTLELNKLIQSLQNEPDVTLVFPKGQYDFYPDNALEMHRAVSNHDNGLKRMVFPLFGHKNITIDGGGSLFMMHGRVVPFTIESVDGMILKNFSIDWIRSFHAEMKVVERDINKDMAIFEIDPEKYPFTVKDGELLFDRYGQIDPTGSNIVFDPQTRAPIYNTNKYALRSWEPRTASRAGENRVKMTGYRKEPPPVGSVKIVYGVHPTSRLCPAIHVTNSNDLKIENVTIYEAGGMGLIVERTENVTLDRLILTSTKERLVCTRADATHFIGCKGTIHLENCLFEHMLDDGINVHGAYVKVEKVLGKKQLLCEISHFQQWGLIFAEPGDKVALLSRETVLPFFETKVTGYERLNEKRFIVTLANVPKELPTGPLSVENLTWNPDLIMRNNIIRENRARSVLVTTKGKVLIEDNYFASQMNGILIEGDNKKWYESGAVKDVIIRNNVFENIGFGLNNNYPLLASPMLTPQQRMGEGQYHRNIRFEGNTLKSFNGHMVLARSVQGLTIANNTMMFSADYPEAKEGASIVLDYCDQVDIKGNKMFGFKQPLTITQSKDTTRVSIEKNSGFQAVQ